MKVGVMLPVGESIGALLGWPELRALVTCVESMGLDSVWVADHLLYRPPDGGEVKGVHEAWTLMSAIAAVTERVQIGSLVICAGFRNPGMVANMAATLDAVSSGRLILGVGAGWHDPEHEAFGFATDHKVSRFEEWVEIVARLVRGERLTFEGRYHTVRDAALAPPPERRIPVLVASHGPRMHGLTARFADSWNTAWFGLPDDRLRERMTALDEALVDAGRDLAGLERTVGLIVHDAGQPPEDEEGLAIPGAPEGVAHALAEYERLGFSHVIVFLEPTTTEAIERLAEGVRLSRG
jgi:alkanesulfonate monooxygenase SsuD/methylene tetrahydromethanopterin reductase-like flavin-dependent oxidoreductase (luciferase family)